MSLNRLHIAAFVFALAVALATAWGDAGHMAAHAVPFAFIAGLLLLGHFVGEERILARRRGRRTLPRRRAGERWALPRAVPPVSTLARGPRRRRGPPVFA